LKQKRGHFLIIRLSSLGDIIHALPAFSAIRKNFPQAEISWLVEEKGKDILELVPGIDRIIPVTVKKWTPCSRRFWREFASLKKKIRNPNQTVIDFQGLIKSGLFAYFSRAKRRIGFHRKNLREPLASLFYTERAQETSENIHVIQKNLYLLTLLGIEEDEFDFPLHLPHGLRESTRDKIKKLGYNGQKKLVVFNVGAAWETKRWPAQRWAKMIRMISSEKLFFLILWGTKAEKALAAQVSQITGVPATPILSLKEVMALIQECTLLVSGDTFALQAACALAKPVVGIFGPTNPDRNGPFRARDKVAFHKLACSYCYKRVCSNPACLEKITPEEVASLCLEALRDHA
jgi:lipopolysaccharide heptosyltransferase I